MTKFFLPTRFSVLNLCVRALMHLHREGRKKIFEPSEAKDLCSLMVQGQNLDRVGLDRRQAELLRYALAGYELKKDKMLEASLDDFLASAEEPKRPEFKPLSDEAIKKFAQREQARLDEKRLKEKRDAMLSEAFGIKAPEQEEPPAVEEVVQDPRSVPLSEDPKEMFPYLSPDWLYEQPVTNAVSDSDWVDFIAGFYPEQSTFVDSAETVVYAGALHIGSFPRSIEDE